MIGTREILLDDHPPRRLALPRDPIDSGGEARIFSVPGEPELAIKLYHRPTDDQAHRLQRMLAFAGHDEWLTRDEHHHPELVWPISVARDVEAERVVGYAMRMVGEPEFHPIDTFFSRRERLTYFPGVSWRFPLGIARNLSALVARLHARNLVVGDLSHRNVVVSLKGYLTILDCDSIEFTDPESGERFACHVTTGEYAPPELLHNESWTRTASTDNFSLAVIIYRLLMLGDHPYMGIPRDGGDDGIELSDNIRNGISYLIAPDRVRIRDSALATDILPPEVRGLAQRAFGAGHLEPELRPPAAEWTVTLQRAQQSLQTCDARPHHIYGGHLPHCPWCARMREGMPDLFGMPSQPSRPRPAPAPASHAPAPAPARGRVAAFASTVMTVIVVIIVILFVIGLLAALLS
jgi:DNA-binding helix-hairpin-helix protein with protein kinase domain